MARTKYQLILFEIWKQVADYPKYEVSTFGRFKKDGVIQPPSQIKSNYITVAINKKDRPLHLLVLETFIGKRPKGKRVIGNHKDLNTKNNRLDNLEYTTVRGNRLHSVIEHYNILIAYETEAVLTPKKIEYKKENLKALRFIKRYNKSKELMN